MRLSSSLLGLALFFTSVAVARGDDAADPPPAEDPPAAPLVVAGEADPAAEPAAPAPAPVMVAAPDRPPVARAEPAPEPESDELEYAAGMHVMAHHISMHGVLLENDFERRYAIDADLIAGAAGLKTMFSYGGWRALSLSLAGGEFTVISGTARPVDGRRGARELDNGAWMNAQVATAGVIDVGPVDLVVEARFSVDAIFIELPGPRFGTGTDKAFALFEGGASVGVRYNLIGCMFVEPAYYAGVAGYDALGYAHGASLTLGCDSGLERGGGGPHPG
jgi:hypothetical protein